MSYIALATTTLSSSSSSITFGSIPTSVNGTSIRDLVLVINGTTTATPGYFNLYFNGSTTGYSRVEVNGTGSTSGSFTTSNPIVVTFLNGTTSTHISQVMDFSASDKHKSWLYRNTITGNSGSLIGCGRWDSTAAITSLNLTGFAGGTFVAGTSVSLYGIAG
jgi:hypothetical protein